MENYIGTHLLLKRIVDNILIMRIKTTDTLFYLLVMSLMWGSVATRP